MLYNTHELTNARLLLETLLDLRREVHSEGQETFNAWRPLIQRRSFLISALNLAYYMALRRRDLRPIQAALIPWGLSSLGRIEARVMPNLDAVINTLGMICGAPPEQLPPRPRISLFTRGERMLRYHTEAVFKKASPERRVRIMVTLPTEAIQDYQLVRALVERGMDCARINCAHDDREGWRAMIAQVQRAEEETGRRCLIAMDLGGPKSRTAGVIFTDKTKDRLFIGDSIFLSREKPKEDKRFAALAQCTLTEALDQMWVGAAVWFDDGKMGAVVEEVTPDGISLRVTQARAKGERFRDDKGVNFPGTNLRLNPLTDRDLKDLDFVVKSADIINYSFVQAVTDIELLQREVQARLPQRKRPGSVAIVAKIETAQAIQNLPELIVHAAGKQPFGVMIARGDLAVEIGYERLAEMQEEIMWLCEAAHVPVIWATQVLETLAKKGRPSRAEMTDAAMAERAECVMLNKGPYIVDAVAILDDVLRRMQAHQLKKTAQLRALRSW